MKYYIALILIGSCIVSAEGIGRAQTCRRSGAAAPAATGSAGSRSVSSPACGSGTTILGTPGRSGRFSVRGDDNTEHRWKGGSYKHPKRTNR